MRLKTGTRVGPYEVSALLGEGGMGEVYRAHDVELDRDVALKLLPERYAADADSVARFRREAKMLAALKHPNIAAIYGVAETDSRKALVLEYVEGRTLADRLRAGPLTFGEAINIAEQVAAALEAAHDRGIIHRDLKPSNVMITSEGAVKVLDFGLAKSVEQPEPPTDSAVTQTSVTTAGTIAGTLPYMSPEQAQGLTLDARSDIFSFGALLYELFSGRPAFNGRNNVEILASVMRDNPPSLTGEGSRIALVVERCLRKDPGDRFQAMAEVRVGFHRATQGRSRRFAVGLVAAALVITIAGLALWGRLSSGQQNRISSIAVLPLSNLSRDTAEEWFSDGMTDTLITEVSKIQGIRVISRTSAMQYKNARRSLKDIARELGVDAIVEGSALRVGDRVRITAQLIDATTDQHRWASSYDRDAKDTLSLHREVAQAIAQEIRRSIAADGRQAAKPVDPEVQREYLIGRYHSWKLNEADLSAAIRHFDRAIQLDPNFAPAYVGLAHAWQERGVWGNIAFPEVRDKVRAAVLRALELDPASAAAHAQYAMYKLSFEWDHSAAESEYRRAIQLDPNNADTRHRYAMFLMSAGRFPEAIAECERTVALDPVSSAAYSTYGRVLYRARRYPEAIQRLQHAVELDPRNFGAYGRLADAYELLGDWTRAFAWLDKADALAPGRARYESERARLLALSGRRSEARTILERLERERSGVRGARWPNIASAWFALGDKDRGFQALDRALDEGELVSYIEYDPKYDSLSADPRFRAFVARMRAGRHSAE